MHGRLMSDSYEFRNTVYDTSTESKRERKIFMSCPRGQCAIHVIVRTADRQTLLLLS